MLLKLQFLIMADEADRVKLANWLIKLHLINTINKICPQHLVHPTKEQEAVSVHSVWSDQFFSQQQTR